jgi:hypothetical protein
MLVNDVLSRRWRDRKAIARHAGLTGSPDESENAGASEGLRTPVTSRPVRHISQNSI